MTGVGSGLHLIGEMFKMTAGIDMVHVPYKGVAQALPEVREQLAAQGAEPVGSSPEEFGKFLRAESAKWAGVIKHANVKAE